MNRVGGWTSLTLAKAALTRTPLPPAAARPVPVVGAASLLQLPPYSVTYGLHTPELTYTENAVLRSRLLLGSNRLAKLVLLFVSVLAAGRGRAWAKLWQVHGGSLRPSRCLWCGGGVLGGTQLTWHANTETATQVEELMLALLSGLKL